MPPFPLLLILHLIDAEGTFWLTEETLKSLMISWPAYGFYYHSGTASGARGSDSVSGQKGMGSYCKASGTKGWLLSQKREASCFFLSSMLFCKPLHNDNHSPTVLVMSSSSFQSATGHLVLSRQLAALADPTSESARLLMLQNVHAHVHGHGHGMCVLPPYGKRLWIARVARIVSLELEPRMC